MLIGAHVSPAGGPAKAVERGTERGCRAIQIFNQNPRAWKPREYADEEIAAFHAAMDESEVDALLIHAVYLLNPASDDREIRKKSLRSLVSSLRAGALLGAHAVVLHPGSALKDGGDVGPALERAAATIAEALAGSERCPLHLENTAGAGGTLGRSFEELAQLIALAGGDERLGVCLDSCHLVASGFDVRTDAGLAAVLDDFDATVGLERLGSLHVNDSEAALGSNRDRHALIGEGKIGREAFGWLLKDRRSAGIPLILETPQANPEIAEGDASPDPHDAEMIRTLRELLGS